MTDTPFADLLDLDGHVTDLSIDRYLVEPMDAEAKKALERHFDRCDGCRERLDQATEFEAGFSLAPPAQAFDPPTPMSEAPPPDNVVSLAEARRRRQVPASAWMGLMAAAAALVLVLQPGELVDPTGPGGPVPIEPTRLKGGEVELIVYADDQAGGRALDNGAVVHPGQRIGFRMLSKREGFAMIVGLDAAGEVYPCWPGEVGQSIPVQALEEAEPVDAAITFDSVLGTERMIAIHCARPFGFEAVAAAVRGTSASGVRALPAAAGECGWDEVALEKK